VLSDLVLGDVVHGDPGTRGIAIVERGRKKDRANPVFRGWRGL